MVESAPPLTLRAELIRLLSDDRQVNGRRRRCPAYARIRDNLKPPFVLVEHSSLDEFGSAGLTVRLYAGTQEASSKPYEVIDRLLPPILAVIVNQSSGYITGGSVFNAAGEAGYTGYEIEVADTRRLTA